MKRNAEICLAQHREDQDKFLRCMAVKSLRRGHQGEILDCYQSLSSKGSDLRTEQALACALGSQTPPALREMIACYAANAGSDRPGLRECAVDGLLTEEQRSCLYRRSDSDGRQLACLAGERLTPAQRIALACAVDSTDSDELAKCLTRNLAVSPEVARCYQKADDRGEFTACLLEGRGVSRQLTRTALCATSNEEATSLEGCLARALLPSELPREVQCAIEHSDSIAGYAFCVSGTQMSAEQKVGVQCLIETGGEPAEYVGCVAGRLTKREMLKCLQYGVGGTRGCFGPNNDLVRTLNQLGANIGENNDIFRAANTVIQDIVQGPGPNNDVVRFIRDAQKGVEQVYGAASRQAEAVKEFVENSLPRW